MSHAPTLDPLDPRDPLDPPEGEGRSRAVHYGCQELREDAERVICGRAHPELVELYHAHRTRCVECRRYHRRLAAVYRRPAAMPKLARFAREREFSAILAQARGARGRERGELGRIMTATSVVGLSAAAAVLALALLVPSFGERLFAPPPAETLDFVVDASVIEYGDRVHIPVRPGLSHQAQHFGRVVGGHARMTDAEGRPSTGESLTVGTRIETEDESLQIALVGRLLASIEPRSLARWRKAAPGLVELGLDAGTLAVRYDRELEDPILQVRTPDALVRVTGTVFTVRVAEDGGTSVAVLRGEVEVFDGEGSLLTEVEAGRVFDVDDATTHDIGRREVAAALALSEQLADRPSQAHARLASAATSQTGQAGQTDAAEVLAEQVVRPAVEPAEGVRLAMADELPARVVALGQIPDSWVVPGLSDDPSLRTLEHVFDPELGPELDSGADDTRGLAAAAKPRDPLARSSVSSFMPRGDEEPRVDRSLLVDLAERERERKQTIERALERCRSLYEDSVTRFRAERCLSDFMKAHGREPEAVEGLLLLGTLRMDFGHDHQSAIRSFEEFLRRAPGHPKAELARYKLTLAAIDAGYIEQGRKSARAYLHHHPDGQHVGRILQRFPELKSAL
ncbi:FecR domain-containing protein [Pseudenhygromyxa sp. WMMC2535]|uniref:FecR domain-containing protein n=1 Tax=Pseudenhygromyxa sp. WMMC2535 TaxID=2712867 RepID=UPI0015559597|nr:FecR domain-containing protein [Pseudenhygromyxa sp. WMMC2535]NVB39057.1 FecR domain-containing protein [Pseudenhygromyxa sp. WMMC2535]